MLPLNNYLSPDKILGEYMIPSIFQSFTQLSLKTKSINLGQGFPNWPIPDFLLSSLNNVVDNNIYSTNYSFGCANLLDALETEYSPIFNQNLDPMKNFAVSTGGAAIISQLCSSLSPEDEVVVIEPYFFFYEPMLRFFRVKLMFVQLVQDDSGAFCLDRKQILETVNQKTKWMFLNSPHNPTGKVINDEEIAFLGELAEQHPQLKFMSDEVYENIVFEEKSLPRVANYKNLFERTINVFSGGKTYSCTGWRIGWAVGPEKLIDDLKRVQTTTNASPSSLIQEAIAMAIPQGHLPYKGFSNFYEQLNSVFLKNVGILSDALNDSDLEFQVIKPEGGYFLTADITNAILQMPAIYLYSEENRADKKTLCNEFLKSICE